MDPFRLGGWHQLLPKESQKISTSRSEGLEWKLLHLHMGPKVQEVLKQQVMLAASRILSIGVLIS